jgi:ribosomal protein S18 acetylase RimI-like enzyme
MNSDITYLVNTATAEQIAGHLAICDEHFVPPLSGRVNIVDYAAKISAHALRLEAWSGSSLAGLVAVYLNDRERGAAFITTVSVLPECTGRGIATRLVRAAVAHAKSDGLRRISLEVASENLPAMQIYTKCGFAPDGTQGQIMTMNLVPAIEDRHRS